MQLLVCSNGREHLAVGLAGDLDDELVERYVYGFPIVGHIPDSGVYRLLDVTTDTD